MKAELFETSLELLQDFVQHHCFVEEAAFTILYSIIVSLKQFSSVLRILSSPDNLLEERENYKAFLHLLSTYVSDKARAVEFVV